MLCKIVDDSLYVFLYDVLGCFAYVFLRCTVLGEVSTFAGFGAS